MKQKMLLSFLGLLLLLAGLAWAGSDAGTQNPFELGAGARALALGGAYAAAAEDVTALFWNPAGLGGVDQAEVAAMHVPLFFDTPYDFFGAAYPILDWGTLALGIVRVATDGIITRDAASFTLGSGTGSFELREYLLGYGQELPWGLRAGAVLKIDQERLLGNFTTGMGLDLGLQGKVAENLTAGIDLQNAAGSPLRLDQAAETLPLNIRLGAAYRLEWNEIWLQRLLVCADLDKSTWRDWQGSLGVECCLFDLFALRGGLQSGAWTAGAGLTLVGFSLDYALTAQELGLTQCFSLTYRFGEPRSAQRQNRARQRQEEMDREAGGRAEAAVRKVREEMNQVLASSEQRFQQQTRTLLARERQTQDERRKQEIEKEYFKSLHYFAGIKDYLTRDYASAAAEFETVLKFDSNYFDVRAYLERARKLGQGGALALKSPEDFKLYYQGIDFYMENKFPEAVAVWKRILEHDPGNSVVLRNIDEAENRISALRGAHLDGGEAAPVQVQ